MTIAKKFYLIVIALFITITVFGQNLPVKFGKVSMEEMQMKVYPNDTSASAVILSDHGYSYFRYNDEHGFQIFFERETRIKIFKKEGYKWADIRIPLYQFVNDAERLNNLKAYTYNLENGKIKKTKLKSENVFKEKESENQTKHSFSMPDVKEGSIIDISYTIVSDFPYNFRSWQFQYEIPVVFSDFEVLIPEYFTYNKLLKGYEPFFSTKTDDKQESFQYTQKSLPQQGGKIETYTSVIKYRSNYYEWTMKDLPALKHESYVPNIDDYASGIEFELSYTRNFDNTTKSYSDSWETINKRLLDNNNFGVKLKNTSFTKDILKTIINDKDSISKKIEKIYNYVNSNVKWNGKKTIFASDDLKDILKNRSGNCADINLLLIAMLNESGINTVPVLLSTRDYGIIFPSHPTLSSFNYVVACIVSDNNRFFLDATDQNIPIGLLPARCLNYQGRIIHPSVSDWISLQPENPSKSTEVINLNLNKDGLISGELKGKYTDYAACHIRYIQNSDKKYEEIIKSNLSGFDISDFVIDNEKNISEPIVIKFKMKENFENSQKDIIYLNLSSFAKEKENPFKSETRKLPVDFPYPENFISIINL